MLSLPPADGGDAAVDIQIACRNIMYFQKTLEDWAKFDINNRTKFDASISSGLAIMANQKHLYTPAKEKSKISVNFARYNNTNSVSQLLK